VKQNSTVPVKALLCDSGGGGQRIYIRESNLSTAWNGDRVLVKLTKEGRRRSPEGEVELILERSIKAYSRESSR